jgi:hypothetical protein
MGDDRKHLTLMIIVLARCGKLTAWIFQDMSIKDLTVLLNAETRRMQSKPFPGFASFASLR